MKWQQIPVSIQRPTPPPSKTSLAFCWDLRIEAGALAKLRPAAEAPYHPSKEKGNPMEVALSKK